MSKLIERTVCNQITQYVRTTGMAEKFQSVYKTSHFTETALIKVKDDILRTADNLRVTCLILLDLSVAFDTVSHPLLLNRFQHHFSIQGTILKWIENYMLDHSQGVFLEDSNSRGVTLDHITLKQGDQRAGFLALTFHLVYQHFR